MLAQQSAWYLGGRLQWLLSPATFALDEGRIGGYSKTAGSLNTAFFRLAGDIDEGLASSQPKQVVPVEADKRCMVEWLATANLC